MKANLYTLSGQTSEITLPASLFEVEVKPAVLAQAIRVLQSRQHTGTALARTRGNVNRTTAKVYAQKHTGRARHGARSAPIYVGGGVAHGPKGILPGALKLPKKLAKLGVLGTLNYFAGRKAVSLIDKLDGAKPKSKTLAALVKQVADNKPVVLLTNQKYPELQQAAKNLKNVKLLPATAANALSLMRAKHLLIDNAALSAMEAWLLTSKKAAKAVVEAKPAVKVVKTVKKVAKTVTKAK